MKLPRIVTEEGRAAQLLNIVMVTILCVLLVGLALFADVPRLAVDDESFLKFAGEAPLLFFSYGIVASFVGYRLAKVLKLAVALVLIWMIVFVLVILARFFYLTGTFEGLHWSYPLFFVLTIISLVGLLRSQKNKTEYPVAG